MKLREFTKLVAKTKSQNRADQNSEIMKCGEPLYHRAVAGLTTSLIEKRMKKTWFAVKE